MTKWKKYLSVLTAATMVFSGPIVPHVQTEAASNTMITDADLTDEKVEAPESWGATPNAEQLWYMKQGTAAFCHFGPNTFNNLEWGETYGTKSPAEIFKLSEDFDAELLVKTVKEAGFSRLMLTAKHHDGFCLWASELTDYDIANTDYKDGKGDILEEISDACTKYNLDMGLYLSPWDIHEDHYGCFGDNNNNSNVEGYTDYNKLYTGWIREICTAKKEDGSYKYGNNNPERRSDRFVEWWMDGAQGSGSHHQTYDWSEIFKAIRETNPNCQIFGTHAAVNGIDAEDKALGSTGGIHWIGNEEGKAADETWAKVNKGTNYENQSMYPRVDGCIVGKAEGDTWSVPEVDTKMLTGWFWRDSAGDNTVKSEKELGDIYFRSVGHGATLLLNLSPNKQGTIGEKQLEAFKTFTSDIQKTFSNDLTKAEGVTASADSVWGNAKEFSASNVIDEIPEGQTYDETYWAPADGKTTGTLEINLGGLKKFDVVSIEEYIQKGQTISSFTVEYKEPTGMWKEFASGKTISSKRLCRAAEVEATAIRINITGAKATPKICNVGVYKAEKAFEVESAGSITLPTNLKKVSIGEAERSGNWNFEADEDGNANSSAWTSAANASATFTFTGTKAWVVGTADPNHGQMNVYIDGVKVDTVNTNRTTRKMGAVLYETADLSYGVHTIKLERQTSALGLSKIYYADGSGIFKMKNSEAELLYGSTTEVEIVRTAGSKGKATITYATSSAGAEQGVNYKDLAGTVTFEDGETSKKIQLEGLLNDNPERMIDGKDFYFVILDAEGGSIAGDTYTHVTLYNADADKTLERAEKINLADYTAKGANELQSEIDTLKEMLFKGTATEKQKREAVEAVVEKINALEKEENAGITLPAGSDAIEVEAEDFTLSPKDGDTSNHVHIVEKADASGGKVIDYFEDGDSISINFYAASAGEYKVKADYWSGRTSENPNAFVWSGTNVENGSLDVYGESGATQKHTAEFTIKVTKKGHGTLTFTAAAPKAGPRIDKFTIEKVCKPAESVELSKKEVTLKKKDESFKLYVKVLPEDGADQTVTFKSSNENAATVDASGVVTAVGNGKAVITVTTADGSKKASCNVLVQLTNNDKPELKPTTPAKPADPTTPSNPNNGVLPAGTQQKVGKGIYKVLKADAKNGTVALVRPVSKTNKTYSVPASVKLNGIRYKVTEISKNAFKKNVKLTKVTIGKNVTKIGANAFSGDKSLKNIKITSKSLKSVGKNAFKGINKNAAVKVPKNKKAAYIKILKKGKITVNKVK